MTFSRMLLVVTLPGMLLSLVHAITTPSLNLGSNSTKPNILLIVADDYGFNDVGLNPNCELETPEIDKLARSGVILDQYYVLPVCTPTRSALLSSRFPVKTGLQVSTISPAKPYGLHLNYSLLSDELQQRGYKTHALGKWHLGYVQYIHCLPAVRGCDCRSRC